MSQLDRLFMRRAVELAWRGRGKVAPNPLVGAVLVTGQRVLAEGWHDRCGGLHAEAMALLQAGDCARGATLYSTLEPCCFRSTGKKQPPCSEHIIRAGVRRVVVANTDPHPQVSGRGVAQLREEGLVVDLGVEAEAAAQLNQGFFTRVTKGRPFIQLKVAQSVDGSLACHNGQSRWITDSAARAMAHRLRAASDAVLVGRGTAMADNPRLTVRLPNQQESCPLRVVLDRGLHLPLTLNVFSDHWRERTVLVCNQGQPAERVAAFQQRGVNVLPLPAGEGQLELLFTRLARDFGCNRVLVEGGAQLLTSLIAARFYDQMVVFIAPLLLGGRASVGPLPYANVGQAPRLRWACYQSSGDQCVFNGWAQDPLVPGGAVSGGWRLEER